MKTVYENLRALDDALPPISENTLLFADVWANVEDVRVD